MFKASLSIALLTLSSVSLFSQYGQTSTSCGAAVQQLQNYAAHVNQMYQQEYWTVIPNVRCPAYDQFGRPFHPNVVQNCRLQWLTSLNNWYMQQSNYVNGWYAQISRACSIDGSSSRRRPAPGRDDLDEPDEEAGEIDTDEIEDLSDDIDEEKTVRIKIPRTPEGFRRR